MLNVRGGHAEKTCGFQSCNHVEEDMLNVHLVPHTHDDVGWLKTVDEYYYGARLDIQPAGVVYILDSVIPQLLQNPSRRFIYVEIAFFWRWWEEQTEDMQNTVKQLVNEGRLEFTLGGWSMNDEGATHYNAIIDQHTLGLQFLNSTFGQCAHPRVAWQIDPFGHSRQQASLFAQMGYDALYFGRIDYQDKTTRLNEKTMEMIWKGSPENIGVTSDLFSGTLFNGYGPPSGFCYDIACQDPPIMDDVRMHDYNVQDRVDAFISAAKEQAKHYTTNHIMMTMGSDFLYSNAHTWYKNLDKLIRYVNQQQVNGSSVNALYSTPSCYTYHVNKANQTYTTKEDDFFPYAIKPHGFLTGFYTSRPAIKGFVRDANNRLQIVRQLHVLANLQDFDNSFSKMFQLEEAMGIVQHHDAISGTEKQAVARDYVDRLDRALITVEDIVLEGLARLLSNGSVAAPKPRSTYCSGLVQRICKVPHTTEKLQLIVWNPLTRPTTYYIRVTVFQSGWTVVCPSGEQLNYDVLDKSTVGKEIIIPASLPSLGLGVFFLDTQKGSPKSSSVRKTYNGDKVVGNKMVSLVFDGTTGRLKQMNNLQKNISIYLEQEFQYYLSYNGDCHDDEHQASGAYIFRPNHTTTEKFPRQFFNTTFIQGKVVQEIRQVFSPWVSQTIRIFEDKSYIEVAWAVGPIPIEDKQGKEVINLYKTDLRTNGQFHTDANGREMMVRRLNHRDTWHLNQTEPVAGNYYPVNSRIYIQDMTRNVQFTVLTDRSEGGSSLRDGEIELMVHRRLLMDDHLGVGEPLNETGDDGKGLVAIGSHYLFLDTVPASAAKHRLLAEEIYMKPMVSFSETDHTFQSWSDLYVTNRSFIQKSLPENVHLLTLAQIPNTKTEATSFLIFRLEHQFERNEDPELSKPVTVYLDELFTSFDIINIEELTLAANMPLKDLNRLAWRSAWGRQSFS
ncbi:lysosomal alpha-mannosidase-like [Haliotis cracherodii]|uniref:lysosomal alpha-mannosidase-like n=1 Tax=Haliotis cracherodii TaxID=6455 RepID=UPI0039E96995